MADLDKVVVGDSMTDIEVTVTDAAGVVKDLTNHTARLFLRGRDTGDLPESPILPRVSGCSWSAGGKTITRATGSFITDGITAGMLVVATGIPEGAYVKTVDSATQVTINTPATAAGSSLQVRFWFGVVGVITDAPGGKASFQSIGAVLELAGAAADVYTGRVRLQDTSSGEVGWTNDARGTVSFEGVTA